jgi:SNF2 family DNA or RNA helicase
MSLAKMQRLLDEAVACVPDEIGVRELDPRLHEYQKTAVRHLHEHARAGLFLDMGLGKTFSVLAALEPEHLPALVIAPKRVTELVWPVEAEKWRPDLTIAVAAGSPAKRKAALSSGADIVAISRDNMKDVSVNHGFRTIVLDELSSWKNRGSQRWRFGKAITKMAPYVWGLTGTPSPNSLMDLWAEMYLIDKGQRLGTTLTSYRQNYFSPGRQLANGTIIEWKLRSGAEDRIYERLGDICLSMKSEGLVDVPPVTFNDVMVPLPASAMRVYEDIRDELVTRVDDEPVAAMNAAVATGKLSQITAGFIYHEDKSHTDLHDEKVKAIQEIIEGTGSPVLVFYRFIAEGETLKKALDARTIDEKGVLDDWNAGKVPVLLAHPASTGHGLNLQHGGHTIIWATLTWSPEEYEQSNARLVRQGQTNPVVIHRLMCPDTVDEIIPDRLAGKISAQEALMRALA